jgi:hypothetical protein
LFVAVPHCAWAHAAALSGVQHVLLAVQTPAFGQVAEHMTDCPQLFVAVVLHLPTHGVALSGVQQALFTQTSEDDEQFTVPPAPHGIVCPQLFVAVPQTFPWQVVVTGSGTQPHEPLVHVRPASHPPQSIICPQLSVLGPHRFWHHEDAGVGEQQLSFDVHTPPSLHVTEHITV